jgi:hypothetical protein
MFVLRCGFVVFLSLETQWLIGFAFVFNDGIFHPNGMFLRWDKVIYANGFSLCFF